MRDVVVVRLRRPLDHCAAAIAPWLRTTAHEVQLRLGGELPRVLATFPNAPAEGAAILAESGGPEAACGGALDGPSRLARLAADRGIDVVSFAHADVVRDDGRFVARAVELAAEGLRVVARDGRERGLAWGAVRLLVRGMRMVRAEELRTLTELRHAMGRALFTGGLLHRRAVLRAETVAREERQGFLFVYGDRGECPVAIYERAIGYTFLGAQMQPSSFANFATLVARLRERCPAAHYDDRLVRLPALGARAVPGGGGTVDNAWHVDFVAHALDLADRAGTLGDDAPTDHQSTVKPPVAP